MTRWGGGAGAGPGQSHAESARGREPGPGLGAVDQRLRRCTYPVEHPPVRMFVLPWLVVDPSSYFLLYI